MSVARKSWPWYWMPMAVFLIGVFSISLLLLVNRLSERRRINNLIIDAVMDVQIKSSTGHLWLEEAVSGDSTAEEALADMDEAIHLIDVVINGGDSEHGPIPEPMKDPELRTHAEAIRSVLVSFKTLAEKRLGNPAKGGIASALDEQFDAVFKEILARSAAMELAIDKKSSESRAESQRFFSGILIGWTLVVIVATAGLWSLEKRRKSAEEALLETQEELVRSEKMAIFGQIAGNVSNELRNPLGVMNNAVYFLKTVLKDPDVTVTEYLEILESEIDNSQRIISDLLDFFRNRPVRSEEVLVRELIRQSLKCSAIPGNIEIRADLPETLPAVRVDPLQMEQVFRNLIANAVQAMPEGGAVSISAHIVGAGLAPARSGYPQGVPLQDFVEISISDTGVGIAPENMEKLFQPLFTTKSRGIGLGLAISRKLTEANGGRIEVESRPGKGATFTMILPAEGAEGGETWAKS